MILMLLKRNLLNIINRLRVIVYYSYKLPELYFNPNIRIKEFLKRFKLNKILLTAFNFSMWILIRYNIASGKNIFNKYTLQIIKKKTEISPKNNTILFHFEGSYNKLNIGNLAVVNQFIRLWVKDNPGYYIIFCTNHLPKDKPLTFELLSMNPDIHEIWCFNHLLKWKIFNQLPNIIKTFDLFKPWYEVEKAIINNIRIPLLNIPKKELTWARNFLDKRLTKKYDLIFTLHVRQDPLKLSPQIYRNPVFETYFNFIKILIEKYNCAIIRLGASYDSPIHLEHVIDTIDLKLSYSKQCALIYLSDVFIGTHSGPQITAAALGTPTFCGSYVEDYEFERKKYKMKSIRTPKIEDIKREVLYKTCFDLQGNRVPAAFDTPTDYKWIDTQLEELISSSEKFLIRNDLI